MENMKNDTTFVRTHAQMWSPWRLNNAGLERSAAIRPVATKKSRLASEKIHWVHSLATESCRLADRLSTKPFLKADNADAAADR